MRSYTPGLLQSYKSDFDDEIYEVNKFNIYIHYLPYYELERQLKNPSPSLTIH
jgi:hypothetical protein